MLSLGKKDFILITDFLHQENGIKGIQQAQNNWENRHQHRNVWNGKQGNTGKSWWKAVNMTNISVWSLPAAHLELS